MTSNIEYPLEKVLDIKKRRVEEQEKEVKRKQEELEREQEKLRQREKERDKAKQHYQDKLKQLRDSLDKGTTSDKVQQKKAYLKLCQERLAQEEQKVKAQQEQVKIAEGNLEQAKQLLKRRRLEVDKLETHRVDWIKLMKQELEIEEQRELDEIGNVMYLSRKLKGM